MHSLLYQSCELDYLPNNSGLEEFDVEDGTTRLSSPPARAVSVPGQSRLFSVIEQYEAYDGLDASGGADAARLYALQRAPLKAAGRTRPARRLMARLACAVVLVAIPSGTPVGTGVLPALPAPPVAAEPVRLAEPVQAQPVPAVTPPPEQAEPNEVSRRAERPKAVTPAAPRALVEPAPALELARLRDALDTLNGLDITLEHCEVRLASTDRAVARCQGIRTEVDPGGESQRQRPVEWTLGFDRAEGRWLIVSESPR
jgi:hypothetical protein